MERERSARSTLVGPRGDWSPAVEAMRMRLIKHAAEMVRGGLAEPRLRNPRLIDPADVSPEVAARWMQAVTRGEVSEVPRLLVAFRDPHSASSPVMNPTTAARLAALVAAPTPDEPLRARQDLILGAILFLYACLVYVCLTTQHFPNSLVEPLAGAIGLLVWAYEGQQVRS